MAIAITDPWHMSATRDDTVQVDSTSAEAKRGYADAVTFRALRVWSWWRRESTVHDLLVFVVATTSRDELNRTCARLNILTPGHVTRLRAHESGFGEAMRTPAQLLWMPLEKYGQQPHHWFHEDQLAAARSSAPTSPGRGLVRHRGHRSDQSGGDPSAGGLPAKRP
ncbi:hypothetical protein [Blastococcus tunisiensis]|uniref:hypothetical protein n=1 Tax=Blastococcus tunisiensis TaxID=1798228 RepID=UPI0011135414|nr:hypothetical protein [Blastococcus sp. DSM 46838]